jgi:hypothetical protein
MIMRRRTAALSVGHEIVSGFVYLLVTKRSFALETNRSNMKEAKPDTINSTLDESSEGKGLSGTQRQHGARNGNRYAERVLAEECKKTGASLTELRAGAVGAGCMG